MLLLRTRIYYVPTYPRLMLGYQLYLLHSLEP